MGYPSRGDYFVMPFMTRYRRRWIAAFTLAAMAFAHVAMAGYGCLQGKMPEPPVAAPVFLLNGGFMAFALPGRLARPLICFSFACIAAAPSVHAAGSEPLSLSETIRLAGGQSRQLAAQDAAVAAAREMSVSAGQLPDPVLRLGVDNLPVTGPDSYSLTNDFMTMRRIGVMQEFPPGEKRRLRSERSEREAEREGASRQATLANVQRDAALAWLDRYYAEQMRSVLERLGEDTQALIGAAEAAYRGGRGSP